MDEQMLISLSFDDYMRACWAVAGKHLPLLGTDSATIAFLESTWARRYWFAKTGKKETEH